MIVVIHGFVIIEEIIYKDIKEYRRHCRDIAADGCDEEV
jgi:hypothetical protein